MFGFAGNISPDPFVIKDMTTGKKLILALAMVTVIAATIGNAVTVRNRGVVAVETGQVLRQELVQSVTANGEIKPKRYVNISSNSFGRIVSLPVAEGDSVVEEQLLLQIESIQTEADVQGAQASLDAAASELEGMEASIRAAEASLESSKAELNRIEADFRRSDQELKRAEELFENGLISREQFDRQEATYQVAVAQVDAAKARIVQSEAQLASGLDAEARAGVSDGPAAGFSDPGLATNWTRRPYGRRWPASSPTCPSTKARSRSSASRTSRERR